MGKNRAWITGCGYSITAYLCLKKGWKVSRSENPSTWGRSSSTVQRSAQHGIILGNKNLKLHYACMQKEAKPMAHSVTIINPQLGVKTIKATVVDILQVIFI